MVDEVRAPGVNHTLSTGKPSYFKLQSNSNYGELRTITFTHRTQFPFI